jgi:hypothetical protein
MRSGGSYGTAEKCIQNFSWEIQREKSTSLEDVQFPVSVPSDIEVVKWEWGRSERINKCPLTMLNNTVASKPQWKTNWLVSVSIIIKYPVPQKTEICFDKDSKNGEEDKKNSDFFLCLSNSTHNSYCSWRPKHKLQFLQEIRQIADWKFCLVSLSFLVSLSVLVLLTFWRLIWTLQL